MQALPVTRRSNDSTACFLEFDRLFGSSVRQFLKKKKNLGEGGEEGEGEGMQQAQNRTREFHYKYTTLCQLSVYPGLEWSPSCRRILKEFFQSLIYISLEKIYKCFIG